jgi:Fic family protein
MVHSGLDELFQSDAASKNFVTAAAKEVHIYANALRYGFERVSGEGLLTNNHILTMQSIIEENNAGFRKLPGTALKNEATGEVIYSPPQEPQEIITLMTNLEQFINDDTLCDWDSLTKMAVIHHQFESIHPFYNGNGRTGRIINILYLVKQGILKIPVLYLSRYINQNKADYYRLLQAVRIHGAWEEWVLFILDGVEETALQTIKLIEEIRLLMKVTKQKMRAELPKIYSQDLLNNLFRHPYTKIEFVSKELGCTRQTAAKYLDELVNTGLLIKLAIARENFYLNTQLYDLLLNASNRGREIREEI